jgi:hypothetical protein
MEGEACPSCAWTACTLTPAASNRLAHVWRASWNRSGAASPASIRSAAKRKQIALAVLGVVAAGAAGYGASHQTTTYSGYATNGYRSVWTSGTIQTYDPAAGILAGAAVGAATGVGIHQIAKAAGFEEQAAQAIFQHSTIRPSMTIVGQVMLKPASSQYGTLRLDVPVDTARSSFTFAKRTTST